MADRGSMRQESYPQKKKKKSGFLSIFLCYIVPYLVINSCILFFVLATPKLQINDPTEHSGDDSVSVLVHVDSVLPIKKFSAKLEGEELNYTRENNNYIIPLSANGSLRISVTSINGMTNMENTQINSFDENPPVIDEDNVVLGVGYVEFVVTDSQSGVDFASIYGIDHDGNNLKPNHIDEQSGKVSFSMKSNSITVYVSDKSGNQVSGNFNLEESPYPKTKSDLEEEETSKVESDKIDTKKEDSKKEDSKKEDSKKEGSKKEESKKEGSKKEESKKMNSNKQN